MSSFSTPYHLFKGVTVCQLDAEENIFYSYETIHSHPKSLGTVLLPKYNTPYKGYECWKF